MRHDVVDMRGQGANGPDIDGIRRARGDSDLACVARSNRTLGLGHGVNLSVSITPDYLNNNFSALVVLVHCVLLLFSTSGPLLILALIPVPDPLPSFFFWGHGRPHASLVERTLSPLLYFPLRSLA